ncbi:hypothetical protein Lesp02_20180 [Lentzea sp. NBRC 105346]|uniref:CHAT domain-containing protein n=1 Tax=Lentzea sp. NBRC 105346 TaxID=3032205 RepID=UPI0024A5EFD6|nr:CHAT domain-containing tetratricopeptide repeat protein [Lentzea sp. NBRC 105346]GLZ29828.1 hypothetical protein Lesp02_20180 [Lentzea sp. NBRC 105346]
MLLALGSLMAGTVLVIVGLLPVGKIGAQQRMMAVLACGSLVIQSDFIGPKPAEWVSTTLHVMLVVGGGLHFLRTLQASAKHKRGEDPEQAIDDGLAGLGLIRAFDRNGDVKSLDAGIEKMRRAVRAGAGTEDGVVYAANLAMALRGRYERLRDPADLDEAIEVARKERYAHSPRLGGLLAQLSSAYRVRHDHFGDIGDLDAALTFGREAVKIAAPQDRASCLSELSAVLVSRYERTREAKHLDEAIDALERAHRETLKGNVVRTAHLTTLCFLLVKRGDFERAVEVGREAVRQVKPGYRLFDLAHNNLALALQQTEDLEEAVERARTAVRSVAPDDPGRATHLANLAMALSRTGDTKNALEYARNAAMVPASDIVTKVTAGLVWSEIAASAGEYAQAVEAFERVIELLPRLASRALRRSDQEHLLGRWAGIAVTAASCAVADGRPEHAVALLEQGRGVLLSRALDERADLRRVPQQLAAEYERLRDAPADDIPNRGRRELAAQWDDVVERIRAEVPDFARPPGLPALLDQSEAGPVVYLNVSRYRSDAVIIENRRVRTVELPGVSPESVATQVRRLTHEVDPDKQRQLHEVLAWIRNTLTDPVLDTLNPERVWWVPTGPLALLPIHAAALDRVVSSYTPTVRALVDARNRKHNGKPKSPLVVAVGNAPGADPLPNARPEANVVRKAFPGARVLANREAGRDRVVTQLRGSAWVHFACHARMDLDSPSRGRLLLADGELTVLDVSALDLPKAELAFLSACETAHPGALFDEVITLASAFRLAGFAHVIATLWPVRDRVAPAYAADVYRLLANRKSPAQAVHRATLNAREKYPNLPVLWAGHVHVGP